jgi:hypothetical protein
MVERYHENSKKLNYRNLSVVHSISNLDDLRGRTTIKGALSDTASQCFDHTSAVKTVQPMMNSVPVSPHHHDDRVKPNYFYGNMDENNHNYDHSEIESQQHHTTEDYRPHT